MITVIIINYFSADLTQQTVQRLLLAPAPPLAIHVVDNSVCPNQQRLLQQIPDIKLWINQENAGFSKACNQVYRQTDSDWVLLLNPDAYLLGDALAQLHQFLLRTPQAAAVGPKVFWDADLRYFLPMNLAHSPWHQVDSWPKSMALRQKSVHYWQTTQAMRQQLLSGGHVLLRRSAVDAVGGLFDEQFFMYYEDEDLFLRLQRAGFDLYCLPSAQAVHVFNGCAREKTAWKFQQAAVAAEKFKAKHYPRSWHHQIRQRLHSWQEKFKRTPVNVAFTDGGVCQQVPHFAVPEQYQDNWLIEFSLSPHFAPAIGCFGQGAQATYPINAAEILPSGQHYVRIGSVERVHPQIWRWFWKNS